MISASKRFLFGCLSLMLTTIFAMGFSTVWVSTSYAQDASRPLLVEGRQTVYQRVLTRPGARLHSSPQGESFGTYPAFQPLYVFEKNAEWRRVGPSVSKPSEGWVKADSVIPWKQNIVAAFTNAAGRSRQIIFDTETRLKELMEDEALLETQAQILAEIENDDIEADRGVIAVEPSEFVSIAEQLYLMPILEFSQNFHPLNYESNLVMKVASVPLDLDKSPRKGTDDFDAGVVFVFDTTQSMGPYIQRSQKAIERIVDELGKGELGEKVQFGVVAFRDSTEAAPGLRYRTKVLLPLTRREDQQSVIETIRAATKVASASSPGFNEDSLAGVEDAIGKSVWLPQGDDPFDARVVILITDAGPKDIGDQNARSAIGPAELQRDAQDKGIAIMTLHLQTRAGGDAQHGYAADQYKRLSRFNDEAYYYGIENGSPEAFEATITQLVTALTDVVRTARNEESVLTPEETGEELLRLGLAMRLAYLGRQEGTQAPDVIEGWISERAIENPNRLAVEPRLLVTKNELATMADYLTQLSELGEQSRNAEDATTFFRQVTEVVARMAQNPDRLVNTEADTLGGALEFLEDLPYRSQLLLTTEERWGQSAINRRSILDGLRQKLVQYRKWLLDPDVWTPLYDDAPDGDYVFAMPFDVLP